MRDLPHPPAPRGDLKLGIIGENPAQMMGIGGAVMFDQARRLDDAKDVGLELRPIEALPRNVVERPRAHAASLRQNHAPLSIHPNARKIARWRRRDMRDPAREVGLALASSPALSCGGNFGGKYGCRDLSTAADRGQGVRPLGAARAWPDRDDGDLQPAICLAPVYPILSGQS